ESFSDKVAMFDQYANKHKDKQSKNPFTSGLNIEKRKFSKEEYGRGARTLRDHSPRGNAMSGPTRNYRHHVWRSIQHLHPHKRQMRRAAAESQEAKRRDDDVPIYLVKPIKEIRQLFNERLKEMAKETSIS
ncbi:unnamed protein product, partial [Heterotrigona itama]